MRVEICHNVNEVRSGPADAAMEFVSAASASMKSVETVMAEVAMSEVPVLLLGEPSAGKKAAARRIHDLSRRDGEPFRILGCLGLEANDVEETFAAPGLKVGTVFLREVADLPEESQTALVKVLSQKSENSQTLPRLICGSARDLEAEVNQGKLREDLYYRISPVCLRLPPLRQRREDIPALTEHFLRKFGRDFHRTVPDLSEETRRLFAEYSWPGNVGELENAAKALVALGDERTAMGGLRAMLLHHDLGINGGRVSLKQAARAASREAEKEIILRTLTRTRWNRRRAAQDLQISYKALLYKLKQIGCSEFGAS